MNDNNAGLQNPKKSCQNKRGKGICNKIKITYADSISLLINVNYSIQY